MKFNCIIRICTLVVIVLFCNLKVAALESGNTFVDAPSYPEGTITLKGNVMCNTAVEGEAFLPERDSSDHELVFFAVTGIKEVDDVLSALLDAHFPAEGMNTIQAQDLIDGFKRDLKFYLKCDAGIEKPGQEENLLKILNPSQEGKSVKHLGAHDYANVLMALTGKIEMIGNKRYFSVSSAKGLGMDYSIYPDRMKMADVPFKPNTNIPDYVLKLNKAGTMTANMKYIPSGDFLMGSPFYLGTRYQDEFPHKVILTKSFYMMEIPVTQAMWTEVTGVEKTRATDHPKWYSGQTVDHFRESQVFGPDKPVEFATWKDIHEFCEKLSEINGVIVRLPTDAEWEYAMRVGSSNPGFTQKYVDVRSEAGGGADVRTMKPNAWGLYDMSCKGWHIVSDYKNDNLRWTCTDPTGISKPWQTDEFGVWMHKAKGGWHHTINAPHMHGAISQSGLIWESGKPIFRVIVERSATTNP